MYRIRIMMAVLVAACGGSEQIVESEDVLAEDSALAREVMTASGDLVVDQPVFIPYVEPESTRKTTTRSTPPRIEAAPRIQAAPQAVATLSDPAPAPRARATAPPRETRKVRPAETRVRTGIISSRTAFTVVTTKRSCGNSFRATVANSVRGTNGVAIPAGSVATGEITSADKWGAGLGVRVSSVRVQGASYPVASRVTYVMPDRGEEACIPGGARIEVDTRAPIRLAISGL